MSPESPEAQDIHLTRVYPLGLWTWSVSVCQACFWLLRWGSWCGAESCVACSAGWSPCGPSARRPMSFHLHPRAGSRYIRTEDKPRSRGRGPTREGPHPGPPQSAPVCPGPACSSWSLLWAFSFVAASFTCLVHLPVWEACFREEGTDNVLGCPCLSHRFWGRVPPSLTGQELQWLECGSLGEPSPAMRA